MDECNCENCTCGSSVVLRFCSACGEETPQVYIEDAWICTVCQESDISLIHGLSGSN